MLSGAGITVALLPAALLSCNAMEKQEARAALRAEKQRIYGEWLAAWPVPYEEAMIPTRFGATHALVSGPREAPLLICLHAMGSGAITYRRNIQALSSGYRVLVLDTIGDEGGFSRCTGDQRPKKEGDYALWLSDVMDWAGREQAALMGCSMGGWIATLAARDLPERVTAAVLVSPAAGIPLHMRWGKILFSFSLILNPSPANIRRSLSFLLGHGPAGELLDYMTVVAGIGSKDNALLYPRKISDRDLGAIRCPVLLLIGEQEVIYKDPEQVFQRARRTLSRPRSAVIPEAGHLGHYDNPQFVDAAVLGFLAGGG